MSHLRASIRKVVITLSYKKIYKKLEEIALRLREMRLPAMANQLVTMCEANELNDNVEDLDES